jgi:hypothetical protein
VKAPLILVKLISFFFYFMANAFAIRFSEMAKPVAKASLRQSVVVPCHFASAKWHIRRIRLWRMHLPFASAKWQSLWRMHRIRQSVIMLNVFAERV